MIIELKVPSMACGACIEIITKAILEADSTASIQADSKTKKVMIESNVSELSLREAIASAGYPPE